MNYSDLRACWSASFLQLYLCFYLVKRLKSKERIFWINILQVSQQVYSSFKEEYFWMDVVHWDLLK